jgi:hypothetical protein
MSLVGHNAIPRVNVDGARTALAESFGNQMAGETLAEPKQSILQFEIQFPSRLKIMKQCLKRLKLASQHTIKRPIGASLDQGVS